MQGGGKVFAFVGFVSGFLEFCRFNFFCGFLLLWLWLARRLFSFCLRFSFSVRLRFPFSFRLSFSFSFGWLTGTCSSFTAFISCIIMSRFVKVKQNTQNIHHPRIIQILGQVLRIPLQILQFRQKRCIPQQRSNSRISLKLGNQVGVPKGIGKLPGTARTSGFGGFKGFLELSVAGIDSQA